VVDAHPDIKGKRYEGKILPQGIGGLDPIDILYVNFSLLRGSGSGPCVTID
jgi:hypothetical protein